MAHPAQVPENALKDQPVNTRPKVYFCGTAADLTQKWGIEWIEASENDWGPGCFACFCPPSGRGFILEHLQLFDGGRTVGILTPDQDAEAYLNEAMELLELTSRDLHWIAPDFVWTPHALFREDTNGALFQVGTFPCRADAVAKIRELTQYVHKQHYFIEPEV